MSDTVSSLQSVPVLFMTSAVYVISASVECDKWNDCGGERGYAVSVGVISTLICLVVLVLQRMGKGAAVSPYGEIIAGFLMFWWLVGACYGTFHGPFTSTSNGYFSAWASFLFATRYAYESSAHVRKAMDQGAAAMTSREGTDTWNQGAGAAASAEPAAGATA